MVTVIPNINIVWDVFKRDKNPSGVIDSIPPRKPILIEIPEYTNKDKIDIKGYAEVGSTVKLYINSRDAQETIADNDGNLAFSDIPLQKQSTEVYAVSIDDNDNTSEPSDKVKIIYDNKEPEIEIMKPNSSNVEELVNSYRINGKTNEVCAVTVNSKIAQLMFDNTFSILVQLNEGGNNFKIEAIDKAGNKVVKDLAINFSKKGPD